MNTTALSLFSNTFKYLRPIENFLPGVVYLRVIATEIYWNLYKQEL